MLDDLSRSKFESPVNCINQSKFQYPNNKKQKYQYICEGSQGPDRAIILRLDRN